MLQKMPASGAQDAETVATFKGDPLDFPVKSGGTRHAFGRIASSSGRR
jgi:hypothetical protein